jgi:hypothetical protein
VRFAIESGVPAEGMCLYPVINHPGWLDERHCYNGVFDYTDDSGRREIYQLLAHELNASRLGSPAFSIGSLHQRHWPEVKRRAWLFRFAKSLPSRFPRVLQVTRPVLYRTSI